MKNNPVRGCGQLKPGGFYLRGDSGMGGALRRLTWVLGTQVSETSTTFNNLYTELPKRAMTFINPAASLSLCRIVAAQNLKEIANDHYLVDIFRDLKGRIGTIGLLDYVGAQSYTAWSFAKELGQYGPSRKVSEEFMLKIAKHLPLPVFFSFPKMPLFAANNDVTELIAMLGQDPEKVWRSPTWIRPEWGMTTHDKYDGSDHFAIDILKRIASNQAQYPYEEMVFCASWFTKGSYVMNGDDDQKRVDGKNLETLRLLSDGDAEVV